MTEQAGEAVPAAQRGSWTSFLKSIASFSGDLSSLTAPPFILSPVSLTEFPAYWCEHPELFSAIADGKTEEDRALAVTKWFISTLKGQYTSRNESMGSEKKPLNPVLGELFYGHWPPTDTNPSKTDLLVEQVSHHPPITAYVIRNYTVDKKGSQKERVRLTGHNAQKTSFSGGSIIVRQIGHATLTVTLPSGGQEKYLITLPRLRIDGLWYGSPYIELTESSYIAQSTLDGKAGGWVGSIEYKGKGYFSGKSHQFKAVLTPPEPSGSDHSSSDAHHRRKTHCIEGTWHTTSKMESGMTFHDVNGPKTEVTAKSIEEQGEWESRKLWSKVSKGIREADFESASKEKGRIENEQRQRRRDEQAAGTTWQLKHFKHLESDPLYEELGKSFNAIPPTEDTYVFLDNWPAP